MSKLPIAAFVLLSAGILGSCSTVSRIPGVGALVGEDGYLRDRSGEYIEAETIPRIDVPSNLDDYVIDDLYVIPDVGSNENHFRQPPRPKPMIGRSERQVVIQSIEDQRWIIVGLSPSQAWPRISDYWARNNVPLEKEEPTQGLMETGWFRLGNKPGQQQKMQVLVEPGFQDNTAEIVLRQLSVPEGTASTARFAEVSTDREVEDSFLDDMSVYLADVSDVYEANSVSLLAGNISSQGKASLETRPSGEQYLLLRDDYRRSWAAVGLALERAGVTIDSRDQRSGVYEVSFTPQAEEEEPGFFGRLLGFDDEPESHTLRVRLESVVDHVNVRVEPAAEQQDTSAEEALSELLLTLMNNIA